MIRDINIAAISYVGALITSVFLAEIQFLSNTLPLFVLFFTIGIFCLFSKQKGASFYFIFLSLFQIIYLIYRDGPELENDQKFACILIGIFLIIGLIYHFLNSYYYHFKEKSKLIALLSIPLLVIAFLKLNEGAIIIIFFLLLIFLHLHTILLPISLLIIVGVGVKNFWQKKFYSINSVLLIILVILSIISASQELKLYQFKKQLQPLEYIKHANQEDVCESGFGGEWQYNKTKYASHGWTFFGIICRGPQSKWSENHVSINKRKVFKLVSSDVEEPLCNFYTMGNYQKFVICNQKYYLDPEFRFQKEDQPTGLTVYQIDETYDINKIMRINNPLSLYFRNPLLANYMWDLD